MSLSVGQRLRQARLDQGLAYEAVVTRTKISEKFLRAIEAEDRSCFPSGFFYKSFVSQYARALSLDPQEIDAQINEALSADAPLPLPGRQDEIVRHVAPLTSPPRAIRARTVASLVVLVLALAACSGFYAWWRKIQLAGSRSAAAAAISASTEKPRAVRETKDARPQATAAPTSVAALPVSLSSAQEPARPTTEATQLSPGYKVLLNLEAREETWLSAWSDGKMVFQGLLAPRDTKTIQGKEVAKLRVGNAGGLEVRLNGKLLAPLGARGQVLVIVFRPDNFEILAPPKESD
ncbi:MAG TPA: RodZ domain-containing protein [Bryobacteraceae bacterium]|nr:RodZ domain-containing protein [Bryobacteraceae bacterium]